MTAIEKLKAAVEQMRGINDDHGTLICHGDPLQSTEAMFVPYEQEDGEPHDENEPVEFVTLFDLREAIREIEELEKREPLPFKQVITDPAQAYYALMAEWKSDKINLAYYKEQEASKRMQLFGGAFPNPKEGTNKLLLADGRTIKATYTINRKIDDAALPVTLQAMREQGVANTDALVRYKAELAKKEWNTLSDENKLLFSPAIIATPGMPQLEIIEAKAPAR